MGPARVGAHLDPGLTVTEGPVSYRSLRPDSEGRTAELRVWEGWWAGGALELGENCRLEWGGSPGNMRRIQMGAAIGSHAQRHMQGFCRVCICLVKTVLPSRLGSPELRVGRSAQEDQGAPRKGKRDLRENFMTEDGWPVSREVYVEADYFQTFHQR